MATQPWTDVPERAHLADELQGHLQPIHRALLVTARYGLLDVDGTDLLGAAELAEVVAVVHRVMGRDQLLAHPVSLWGAGEHRFQISPTVTELEAAASAAAGVEVRLVPTTSADRPEQVTFTARWTDGTPWGPVGAATDALLGRRPARSHVGIYAGRNLSTTGLVRTWGAGRQQGSRARTAALAERVDLRPEALDPVWASLSDDQARFLLAAAGAQSEHSADTPARTDRAGFAATVLRLDALARRAGGVDGVRALADEALAPVPSG